jgi:two-component system response regulator NreC
MQKRILVVDDNQAVRLIVRSTFEMQGPFIVHEAFDGVDAVEKAHTLNPDLVVMDLSMPRMHGLDATRRLKKEHPPVHVILFTMHQGALSEIEASQAGVDAVVSKSDGLETLLHRVEQLLHQPVH